MTDNPRTFEESLLQVNPAPNAAAPGPTLTGSFEVSYTPDGREHPFYKAGYAAGHAASLASLPIGAYAGLVERLEGAYSTVFERSLAKKAADAIKALVQERDHAVNTLNDYRGAFTLQKERAERAELMLGAEAGHAKEWEAHCKKAESELAECLAMADGMAANCKGAEVIAYRAWRKAHG